MSNTNKPEKRLTSGDLPFDDMDSLSRQERLWLTSLKGDIVKGGPQKLLQKQGFVDAQGKAIDISKDKIKLEEQQSLIITTTESTVSYLNHRGAFISKDKRSQRESVVLDGYINLITYWNKIGGLTQEHKNYVSKQFALVDIKSTTPEQKTKIDNFIAGLKITPKSTTEEEKKDNASEATTNAPAFESGYEISKAGTLYAEDGGTIKQVSPVAGTKISIVPNSKKATQTANGIKDLVHIKRDNQEAWVEPDIFKKTPTEAKPIQNTNNSPSDASATESPQEAAEVNKTTVTKYVNVRSRLNTRTVDGDKVGATTATKLSKGDKVEVDTSKTTTSKIGSTEYDFVQIVRINDKIVTTPVWVASKYLVDNNVSAFVSKPKVTKEEPKTADKTEPNPTKTNDKNETAEKPEGTEEVESTEEVETEEERLARETQEAEAEKQRQLELRRSAIAKEIIDSAKELGYEGVGGRLLLDRGNKGRGIEFKVKGTKYSTITRFDDSGVCRIGYSNDGGKNFYFMPLSVSKPKIGGFIAVKLNKLIATHAGKLGHDDPAEISQGNSVIPDGELVFDHRRGPGGEISMKGDHKSAALFPSNLKLSDKSKEAIKNWINMMHRPGNKESIRVKGLNGNELTNAYLNNPYH